ncbi:MAG: hypothetical protein MN733_27180 [Nitrososphaera sp.]|nr:hypothetical protein [Nitrososphaera sp.]
MDFFQRIVGVFSDRETIIKTVAYSIGLLLLFGIPTALLSNPIIPYIRPIMATPFDYIFLFTTSLLGGVYMAIPSRSCAKDRTASGGALLGFLAFGCPTCNYLLVLLLGYTLLLDVFDPLRPAIGLVSMVFLLYAINKKAEGKGC